jgi:hypothetical protein
MRFSGITYIFQYHDNRGREMKSIIVAPDFDAAVALFNSEVTPKDHEVWVDNIERIKELSGVYAELKVSE